jgi:hypothetical protein
MQKAFLKIRIRLVTLGMLLSMVSIAQSGTPRPVPSQYVNPKINYVRTWDVVVPVIQQVLLQAREKLSSTLKPTSKRPH